MGAINYSQTGINAELISGIVEVFYQKMLDDYRVNRFFTTRTTLQQQAEALKRILNYKLSANQHDSEQWKGLLGDYFMTAFARVEGTHSLVTGNDFMFLLDVIGGQEIRPINLLCDAHSHLMKLMPDDDNYDVVMEHVAASLQQLNVNGDLNRQLLAMAEGARPGVLAR
jgi:hypothetical protein